MKMESSIPLHEIILKIKTEMKTEPLYSIKAHISRQWCRFYCISATAEEVLQI